MTRPPLKPTPGEVATLFAAMFGMLVLRIGGDMAMRASGVGWDHWLRDLAVFVPLGPASVGVVVMIRMLMRRRWIESGACDRCGYAFPESGICPECGHLRGCVEPPRWYETWGGVYAKCRRVAQRVRCWREHSP